MTTAPLLVGAATKERQAPSELSSPTTPRGRRAPLSTTQLSERDKLSAVMSLLYYVRGVAALEIESGTGSEELDTSRYPDLLRRVIDRDRFPAVAAALDGGAFVGDDDDCNGSS